MKNFILALLAGAMFAPVGAQTLSPDLQIMLHEQQTGKHLMSNDKEVSSTMRLFVRYSNLEALDQLMSMGIQVLPEISTGYATAVVPIEKLAEAASVPGIEYIERGGEPQLRMRYARAKAQVDQLHKDAWQMVGKGYTGNGVVVGVIDIGLEYNHVNFRDADGNLRIKRVWKQDGTGGVSPKKFGYGVEYTSADQIKAAVYDTPAQSHATHVTGIAAGSERSTNLYGVAPDADIVFVSFGNNSADVANAIRYIFDYADEVGKPCVINMSLGSHQGPHDGTSALDRAIDSMVGPGRIIVGACGNEGQNKLHINKKFSGTDLTLKTMLSFSIGSKYNEIDIWNRSGKNFTVQGVVVDNLKAKVLASTAEHAANNVSGYTLKSFYADETGIEGYMIITSSLDPDTEHYNVLVKVQCDQAADSRKFGLIIKGEDGDEINLWSVGTNDFINASKAGWTAGTTNCTVGEIGGTAKRIISVGSYNSSNIALPWWDPENAYQLGSVQTDIISTFSSEGPTADGRLKPEISAPGMLVLSSVNSSYITPEQVYGPRVQDAAGNYYYYDADAGTSMASPMVAGTIAAWLEAYPELTPEEALIGLKEGALTDTYTGECPNNKAGYGKLGAYYGIMALQEYYASNDKVINNIDSELKVWANPATRTVYTSLAGVDEPLTLTLYSISGAKVASYTANANGTINVSELPHGVYVATATCSDRTTRVKLAL